jgi:excinuclease ABC subunit C
MSDGSNSVAGFEEAGSSWVDDKTFQKEPCKSGVSVIRRYLHELGEHPGVYRMLDQNGHVLYVGKARSLRKRVSSYIKPEIHTTRIQRVIHATAAMVFVITETETEALLLEASLIKELKPRYNVLLRDDKSFPYIHIEPDDYPALKKYRGRKQGNGRYFGPFASTRAVNNSITQLQKAFLLRNCSDNVFKNRSRPCLLYQIKRCSAPCVNLISPDAYQNLVDQACEFLSGNSHDLQKKLAREMEEASIEMNYERASVLRDRIYALTRVQSSQSIHTKDTGDYDVVALCQKDGHFCIQVFFFGAGQHRGNKAYFPKSHGACELEEVLETFLGQFYHTHKPPKMILVSDNTAGVKALGVAFSHRYGYKVTIRTPRKNIKRQLMLHALKNAKETLSRRLAEASTYLASLKETKKLFALDDLPKRVEVYDNSHIQGSYAVGVMIVADQNGFQKSEYRKFKIRTNSGTTSDDFSMMQEVLTRRFENPDMQHNWPDLVIVDGGQGQVRAAQNVLTKLVACHIRIVGIAKGPDRNAGEEVFYTSGKKPFTLPKNDTTLYFLQRLRDEAHRFAIGFHKQRRKAGTLGPSGLQSVPGIGKKRNKDILNHFGSINAVKQASVRDFLSIKGINKDTAENIYYFFHEDSSP